MKTLERPRTAEPRNPHVTYRSTPTVEPEVRPTLPPIRTIERRPVLAPQPPARRPITRWLGLLAIVVLVAAGAVVVSMLLDDESTTSVQGPWTPESRGLVADAALTVQEPWTAASRGLVTEPVAVPTVETPWTPQSRGLIS